MAHPRQHGLGHVNTHPKKRRKSEDCGVFLMAWHLSTRMVHQASVSAQMFCAQDKA
jgi:hypothetical protein